MFVTISIKLRYQDRNAMSQKKKGSKKVCQVTGKRPKMGGKIIHKGISKKAGGIGLQLVKTNKRKVRPNLQRVRAVLPSGEIKRIWVSVKALKAGKIVKAARVPKTEAQAA